MAEYIEREAANEALRECARVYPTSFYNGIEVARTAIHKLPAVADVAEVVRCKDCRSCMEFTPEYKEISGYYATCRRLLIPMLDSNDARVKADDFCSKGERKEGRR